MRRQAADGLERRLRQAVWTEGMDEAAREEAAAPYRARLAYELGVIAQMRFPGLFPHRLRLHPLGQGPGHPGGAGPWLGCRLRRRLVARDHRPRPLALRPPLRALPQPRARVDAGLRRRLLRGAARPGHQLCLAALRCRPRGADHHLRHAPGPCRAARRRPGDGPAVRARGPGVQARPAQPRQPGHPGAGAGDGAAAQGGAAPGPVRGADDRHRAQARRPAAARQHACGRRGDRGPPLARAGPALPRPARADAGDPVQHEGRREGRAGQVRLPRPLDADHAAARGRARERARHPAAACEPAPGRPRHLRAADPGRDHRHLPARIGRHARCLAQAPARHASRTSSPWSRSTGRARWTTSRATPT